MTEALAVANLSFSWREDGPRLLEGLSFTLSPGEMLGITGPSGSGKSTLCLCISGIIPHQIAGHLSGEIRLLGRPLSELTLPAIATSLGIVFQDPETQLFLPVIRNELAFGPENLCVPRDRLEAIVDRVAADTGITPLLESGPNAISGGQQQITALAAVLALNPRVLVLDEVTSQLDSRACCRIQEIIALLRQRGVAILMVEHNMAQLRQADRVLRLEAGSLVPEGGEDGG